MVALKSSTTHYSCLPGNRSLIIPHFHPLSVKIPFLEGPLRARLVSVCCQTPNSDSLVLGSPGNAAGSNSSTHLPDDHQQASAASVINFLTLCHSLKVTKRKGWINHGIKGPESIADHMYRMSLMALIACDLPGVDRERCIKMAIVHDIAEALACTYNHPEYLSAIVGDITPADNVPKAVKSKMEQAALKQMCEILGGSRAEEITELWEEYENNASLEAKLVKDFDKIEMILQALEYEMEHGKVLDEFYLSTAGKIQTEIGKSWAAEIHARRKARLKTNPN